MIDSVSAFGCALRGIARCISSEPHARAHLMVSVLVVCSAFFLRAGIDDWCWFIFAIGLVFTAELVNTSIERLADRTAPELHPLIRDAKDMAAGAVLVASIASAIIGLIRFWPLLVQSGMVSATVNVQ